MSVSTCSETASIVHLLFQRMSDVRLAFAGRRYPFILVLIHIKNVLGTSEVDSLLMVEYFGFIQGGTHAATRSVFVLSLVRYDSQAVRTRISMTYGCEWPAGFSDSKELQAQRARLESSGDIQCCFPA